MAFTQNDILWLLISALLVFSMQAGFLCLEIGLTQYKNSVNIAIKNIADFALAALLFWAVGYGLMFGATRTGFFGTTSFIPQFSNLDPNISLGFFVFQIMFCATAVTIISGAVAGRLRFGAYLLIAIIISLLVYPLYGHWVWNGLLDGTQSGWLGQLGFYDFAGATVVHGVGGWAALAAIMIIGARNGRFNTNNQYNQLPASNTPLALLGVMVLFLGWFGFNGGSQLHFDAHVPTILINTILAGSSGLISSMLIVRMRLGKITAHSLIIGSLAGLVAITAGANAVSSSSAIIIGAVAGLLANVTQIVMERQQLDDPIGAVPVHLTGAIWGTLAVGLFGDPRIMLTGLTFQQQLGAQLVGIAVNGLWSFGVVWTILTLVRTVYRLRVSTENTQQGVNGAGHLAPVGASFFGRNANNQSPHIPMGLDVAHFNDIQSIPSGYHRILDSLEQETLRYQTIVDHSRDGIIMFGQTDLKILTINPAAQKLFAISAKNSLNQPISILLNLSAVGSPLPLFRYINDNAQPYPFIGRRPDGTEFPIELALSATIIDGNAVYISSIRDNTERAAQQVQLEILNADLVASNLHKDAFMASMSHELRTPLNAILGMSEALEAEVYGSLNGSQRTATHHIQTSGRHLLEIIDEILDLSAISAGKQKLDLRPVEIKAVCEASLALVSAQAEAKQIVIATKYDLPLQLLLADPKRLKQILVNLLNNAIKFTPNGGRVGLMVVASACKSQAHFIVWDNGIGIDEAAIPTIFQPFVQADNGPTRHYGGTGLGLTIVQRLVELHDGTIQVSSELDKGSRFVVTLPWKQAESVPSPVPSTNGYQVGTQPNSMQTVVSVQDTNKIDYSPPSILLAEDNEPNIATLNDYLISQGYQLYIARNGLEALELYEQFRPNIILMDIQMPKMDGLTAIRILRESYPPTQLPIIALTAFAMPGDKERTLEAGATAYLTKPIRLKLLVQTIQIELNKVSTTKYE